LMASYAYYKEDDPIFSDAFFDNMGKTMLERWDDITHYHKEYINKDDLEAGTFLGEYPSRVEGALRSLRSK
jgi:NAD-dependent DNA ligase